MLTRIFLRVVQIEDILCFEINVGKRRIRHRTTLNLNDVIFNRFLVYLELQFQIRSMSDPPLSDIYFKTENGLGPDYH